MFKNFDNSLLIILLLSFITLSHAGSKKSAYHVAASAQNVQKIISKESKPGFESWIIFDLYHTLVQPKHPATHAHNMDAYKKWLKKELKTLTNQQLEYLLNSIIEHEKGLELTDPHFKALATDIVRIRKHQISFLTTSFANAFSGIKSVRDWTINTVEALLGESFIYDPITYQSELVLKEKPQHPLIYKNRFAFTNGEYGLTKGEAMALLAAENPYDYNTVIMIDDKEKNLISVESALKAIDPNIKFIGILFKLRASCPKIAEDEFRTFWRSHILKAKKSAA